MFRISNILKRCDDYGKLLNRFCGPAFVGFATSLISLIAFTYFVIIFPGSSNLNSLFGIFNCLADLSISLFLTFNIYFNYIKAITTDAGSPIFPSISGNENIEDENMRLINVRWNFCKKCSKPKPPRCHHCSVCDRCVLKMDHHCPWISRCVGYYNYRYFFLFLSYLWVSVIYVLIHSVPMMFYGQIYSSKYTEIDRMLVVISSVGCLMTFFAVGGYGGFHVYLIATNQTSIENLYPPKKKPNYNTGSFKDSFDTILGKGDYWFSGFLPTNKLPDGNGCYFKTITNDNDDLETINK